MSRLAHSAAAVRSVAPVRLLLAAMTCAKGDLGANLAAHLAVLERAAAAGVDVAVFPEMSLTGSVDPMTHPDRLVGLDHPAVAEVVAATGPASGGVAAVFGVAERDGPSIAQVAAVGGRVAAVQRKRHLGEGEEAFRAAAAGPAATVDLAGRRLAVAICAESTVDPPFDEAAEAGAGIVALCAAPGLDDRCTDEAGWRRGLAWWGSAGLEDARRHARRLGLWVAVCTQAGSTDDEDFPGLAALVDPGGDVVARLPDWRPGELVVDVP
jgi:NAD+ synthase (glutamine-hydrolysing)